LSRLELLPALNPAGISHLMISLSPSLLPSALVLNYVLLVMMPRKQS